MTGPTDIQHPMEIWGDDVTTASTITVDSSSNLCRSRKYIEGKKRKIDVVYASGSWTEEDQYEIMKVRQFIRNHVFKHLKFVKGEGRRALTTMIKEKKC